MSARHRMRLEWNVIAAASLAAASVIALGSAAAQENVSTTEGSPSAERKADREEQQFRSPNGHREDNAASARSRNQREHRTVARDIARADDYSDQSRSDIRQPRNDARGRASRGEIQSGQSARRPPPEPGDDVRNQRQNFGEDNRRPHYDERDGQGYLRDDRDQRLDSGRRYDDRYERDSYSRQSYSPYGRDRYEDDEPNYREDRRADRLERRGALRERLRERLDEARENPEEFADRIGTIIRRAEQVGTMLGSSRAAPSLGVNLDTRTPGRVRVTRVIPDSPASRAGLQPGDEILLIDGRRVSSRDLLVQYLSEIDPVEEAEIVVRRGGQDLTLWADFSPQADEPEQLTDEVYEPSSRTSDFRERYDQ